MQLTEQPVDLISRRAVLIQQIIRIRGRVLGGYLFNVADGLVFLYRVIPKADLNLRTTRPILLFNNRLIVKQTFSTIFLFAALLSIPANVEAQIGSDNHTVTVQVSTVTVLQVSSGVVNLNITGAGMVAGQDQMMATDQSTSLLWGINSSNKKITVNTNLVNPTYTLKILAVSPTVGIAAGEVTLSTTPADFLLNVGRSSGSCQIRYTAIALASQGTGSDNHQITFTVQTQ